MLYLTIEHQFETSLGVGMDEWFALFAGAVWRYLDRLGGDPQQLPVSDTQKLAAAWRTLLRMHEAGGGECARCKRGHAGSCTVWQVAIGYFVNRR